MDFRMATTRVCIEKWNAYATCLDFWFCVYRVRQNLMLIIKIVIIFSSSSVKENFQKFFMTVLFAELY